MSTKGFEKAVDGAKKHFKKLLENHPTARGRKLDHPGVYQSAQNEIYAIHHLQTNPRQLIEYATEFPDAFEGLELAVAYFVENNWELPNEARDWLFALLRHEIRRPSQGRTGPRSFDLWEFEVAGEVSWISVSTRLNLKPTRNPATVHRHSGCDAVAEALRQLSLRPSTYDGVLRIWNLYGHYGSLDAILPWPRREFYKKFS